MQNNLEKYLVEKLSKYLELEKAEKKDLLDKCYHFLNMSFPEIAKLANTYPNKIRRDAISLGITIKSRSEAQKVALKSGRHSHPTKDKKRSKEEKIAISNGMAKAWENLSDEERKRRSDIGKTQWDSMTDSEKEEFRKRAGDAVRQASREGSKLEKHLQQELLSAGFIVEFHKEQFVVNERLQIDIFLPKLGIAIEVDGPSHFTPIWGKNTLERNQRADKEKTGLILGKGLVFIRVIQDKSLSEKFKRDISKKLIDTINDIRNDFPPVGKRYIEIGV